MTDHGTPTGPRAMEPEPTTDAGRRLLHDWQVDELDLVSLVMSMQHRVVAIEAAAREEGRREARADAAEQVARLREALDWAMHQLRGAVAYRHPPECSPAECVCGWKRAADLLDILATDAAVRESVPAAPQPWRHDSDCDGADHYGFACFQHMGAAASPAGLDAERLAQAMISQADIALSSQRRWWLGVARLVAAEYARLASPGAAATPQDTEEGTL